MGIGDHLTCLLRNLFQIKKLELDMEQTGSKYKKEYVILSYVILSPCLFNLYAEYIMQNAGLDEA